MEGVSIVRLHAGRRGRQAGRGRAAALARVLRTLYTLVHSRSDKTKPPHYLLGVHPRSTQVTIN